MERNQGNYRQPKDGWTCFHCGEQFTSIGSAQDHFGATPEAVSGCLLKVSVGGERGLLMHLRKAEEAIALYMREDTDLHRALFAMQTKHADALRDAEQAGYDAGLKDGMEITK